MRTKEHIQTWLIVHILGSMIMGIPYFQKCHSRDKLFLDKMKYITHMHIYTSSRQRLGL